MAMGFRPGDEFSEREQAAAEQISVQSPVAGAAEECGAGRSQPALIDTAMDEVMVSFGDALRRLGE